MNIKNNIEIIKLDDEGRGIGYINNKIVFIANTLIGEIVDIEIIKETSKYYVGKVINYIKISDKRKKQKCPYYLLCGGCNILHMSYDDQIEYKKEKLKNILDKFAKINIDIEVIKNKEIFGYRNKIDLKIVNGFWGYYNSNTHDFVNVNKCLIAKNSINDVLRYKKYFKIKDGNIIIRSNYNDEILISINSSDKVIIDVESLKKYIKLVGIIVNDNLYYGDKFFIEKFNNKLFKVNYNSFFQVNSEVTKEMVRILKENSKGNTLLDLYCGVGFLGQAIDFKYEKIYGIEINKNSIIDAIYNAKMNNIDNAYYICGDSSKITNIKESIDTLFIDPPRTGLVKNLVNEVIKTNAKNIVYVSCNPISLARDLNILKEKYDIKKIYLLDMFTNTHHVETISILNIKG